MFLSVFIIKLKPKDNKKGHRMKKVVILIATYTSSPDSSIKYIDISRLKLFEICSSPYFFKRTYIFLSISLFRSSDIFNVGVQLAWYPITHKGFSQGAKIRILFDNYCHLLQFLRCYMLPARL